MGIFFEEGWLAMRRAVCGVVVAVVGLGGSAVTQAQEAGQDEGLDASRHGQAGGDAAVLDRVAESVVIVEHTFRYDRGEAPEVDEAGMAYRGAEGDMEVSYSALIGEERPAERMGFVIAPDLVLTVDPLVHGRFLERIEVVDGARRIGARPEAYALEQNAVLLRLDEPLETAAPLEFDAGAEGPYTAVSGRHGNGRWWLTGTGAESSTMIARDGAGDEGPRWHVVRWPSVVVTEDGTAVGATFNGGLTVGDWKRAPGEWEWISAEDLDATVERVSAEADRVLPRVQLRFRSPRQAAATNPWDTGEDALTEWNGTGVLLDERRVLVLASLDPKTTARLERATVHAADGRAIGGSFAGSLRDYGGLLLELEESAGAGATVAAEGLRAFEDDLLVRSQVRVLGENRTSYAWPARLARMTVGFRGRVLGLFGEVSSNRTETGEGSEGPASFLFTTEGELTALPLMRRDRVSAAQDWRGYSRGDYEAVVLGAADLGEVLGAENALDADNRPLSEAEENRLAWLGVELQAMDPDLARFNNVADLTGGGETGGIVTYVYEGSPAERAGLRVGDILLRLHIEGRPRPLEVEVNPYDMGWGAQFLEVLEQIDASYFDRVPPPWGSAETDLTRALTDVGFGTPFTAEVFREGEVLRPEFEVEEGPAHFAAAERFKSEELGLTVTNLTYEARRFLQRQSDEPGVVVSRVEAGERAAVAGVKPFELIVSVNDEPVFTVEEFEEAISAGGELRLAVMRMHRGRLVRVQTPEAAEVGDAGDAGGEGSAGG